MDKAHEIRLETQLQQSLSAGGTFCLVKMIYFLGSKLTEHLQIMAVQQQKKAITEEKRVREQNIKMKAQIDSVSAGMIAPAPFSTLSISSPDIFNALQLPALPSPTRY